MAAPVRIESAAFADPRIELLGQLSGYSRFEALGRLAHLWSACTERQVHVASEALVRACIGPAGVQHMLEAELAERVDAGLRIKGTDGRIEWLGDLSSKRQHAGRERAAKAARDARGRLLPAHAGDAGPSTSSTDQHTSSTPPAKSSALTSTSTSTKREREDSDTPAAVGSRVAGRKPKPNDPTPAERSSAERVLDKLSQRNGVRYTGSPEHIRLIVAQLRAGASEADLRMVVGYCAIELEWADKPEMATYLRPETLFGPKTINRYLDPARTWAEKQGLTIDDQAAEAA